MAKWLQSVVLIGILSFSLLSDGKGCFPTVEDWDKIMSEKIPRGRNQLETYKEIYKNHAAKYQGSSDEELCKTIVEGLQTPLHWLYANAYQRLVEFETGESDIIQKLGKAPTAALKQLFEWHVADSAGSLSVNTFKSYVYDVVDLLDLSFHYGDENLLEATLEALFSNKNTATAFNFFSPVFLKKQGLSIQSINFAFFGEGPFLAIVEVGPIRNAHQKMYSQTNRRFIDHDLLHASETIGLLVDALPTLFSRFQAFYSMIESLKEEGAQETNSFSAKQDLLHRGLYLLGHEYVKDVLQSYTIGNAQPTLQDVVTNGIKQVSLKLKKNCMSLKQDEIFLYFHKDNVDSIVQITKKYFPEEEIQTEYQCLDNFNNKFMEAAMPLLIDVDKRQDTGK